MNFTPKTKETIDACRFCWMCRHICPIGNATGQERNTARARGLALSMVARGSVELKGDVVDNVYECALCGGCTGDCATGWDPVLYTKEARLTAALNGEMPAYVQKLVENIMTAGNIYGEKEIAPVLKEAIADLPEQAEVLFFIGKDAAYRLPEKAAKAVELLKKLKVNFTVHKYEPNSGYDMDFLLGAANETRQLMEATARELGATGAKTIVCYDPGDAKVFLREYKEYGIELQANVVSFPRFLAELKPSFKKGTENYTFQDPPALARDLEDTASARELLAACGELKEMLLQGKDTMLAGNLIMNCYIPHVMKLVAENRWANADHVGAEVLVTAAPAEYALLAATAPAHIRLMTLEEVLLQCL